MIEYITSFLSHLFWNKSEEDDDKADEELLATELLKLSLAQNTIDQIEDPTPNLSVPDNVCCFHRTGIISYFDPENNYILIDGFHFFDTSNCPLTLNLNDKVLYLGYHKKDKSTVIVRLLENKGLSWGDEEDLEETEFKVDTHIIVGHVKWRNQRFVYLNDDDLKFSLDDVEGTMVPVVGDVLQLSCTIQLDEEKSSNITAAQVLKVISFKPLKLKIKSATINKWDGEYGTCDNVMFFDKHCLSGGIEPAIGLNVLVEAIENNSYEKCVWRVIKMMPAMVGGPINTPSDVIDEEELSLETEREQNVEITHPLKFDDIEFSRSSQITLNIKNNSNRPHIIRKWMFIGSKRNSQLSMYPALEREIKLFPGKTFSFEITCRPKILGGSKELLVIMFRGFKVQRMVKINVLHNNEININSTTDFYKKTENEKFAAMKNIRSNNTTYIPGNKPIKPPHFISVRLGTYNIPNKLWSIFLEDSDGMHDYGSILTKIENTCPALVREISIHYYAERWHTLLYLEEIQENINMRVYDTAKAYLVRKEEYLALEISGLSERRPSLVIGDRAIVKDIWSTDMVQYEGFIHAVNGDLVLMKFNRKFHESYTGSDVSLEFHFSRSTYRRAHHAIDLALRNLGADILFPKRISPHPSLLLPEHNITWFNEKLNSGQKTAVKNILMGHCRSMPYCIYGPPGTGKTVTVIETILQILTLSDSRILVATPSNSAANLITERLIDYKDKIQDSFVRVLAFHLIDSVTVPQKIKRYCATLDIGSEHMGKGKSEHASGVNTNCPMSYIGRHRVTIGTCNGLGNLVQMGFPRGHFTHIIVDEAGQATEPEIMIPFTLTDKHNGQIVLAGDPMQLGPLVMSRYCTHFGMDESYLSRLLETFPYQKDFTAYPNGFNEKLVTRLNENYRSLNEVLSLPSQMFYDGTLVPNLDRNQPWVHKMLDVVSDVFGTSNNQSSGIFVYGIRGYNARAEDSPSWFNPEEAAMVALTACKLFNNEVSVDDIGIITPYIAQIKYLRILFEGMGLPQPKIGTVEEFQGQERPIIIISTVRSSESLVNEDVKHSLGFLRCPKRFNVALTRAQVAVFLFCNPHLLSTDPCWARVITQAVKEEKYTGCDLDINNQNNVDEIIKEFS